MNRAIRLARHPVRTASIATSRLAPRLVLRRNAASLRRAGVAGPAFILSFDCDTDADIDVAWEVHQRVTGLGIEPAYAVCGELLARGVDVYGRIAATGAEFLNHGYVEHAAMDPVSGEVTSTVFFDQIGPAAVEDDVRRGHEAVQDVLAVVPTGFRTPHFGTYQAPDDLRFLHRLLAGMGYRYSSSTLPSWQGPIHRAEGIWEIGVSGAGSRPLDIIDSWTYFVVPGRTVGPDDFRRELVLAAERTAQVGGMLNIYADPSHVADCELFFATLADVAARVAPTTFRDLVARLGP